MRRTRTYDVDAASAGEALAQIADLLVEVESIRMLIQTRLEAVREYVDSRKGRRGHERLAETTRLLRGALAPARAGPRPPHRRVVVIYQHAFRYGSSGWLSRDLTLEWARLCKQLTTPAGG